MAAIANLYVDQGTTFSTSVLVTNDDDSALDLTGYTAAAQLRKSFSSSTSVDFTVTIPTPVTAGQINLQLSATETASLEEGRYVYDVEITSGVIVTRVIEGLVTVSPQVTK
tara:strand:+ start:294 stop:626 length:333 start_codon:yes stop_codon:yes gene_type:complete